VVGAPSATHEGIDHGKTGELVCRLLCILARDQLPRPGYLEESATRPNYAQAFGVVQFLEAMFSDAAKILMMPAKMGKSVKGLTIASPFKKGLMNFTYFVSTDSELDADTNRAVLHRLLFSQAALQLTPNRPVWDILIPIDLGDLKEPFDDTKVTAMVIQVKNSNKPNKLTLKKEKYEGSLDIKNPSITIHVELGTANSAIIPVDSFSPHVFAFRISGPVFEDDSETIKRRNSPPALPKTSSPAQRKAPPGC
jgi:hypothetical protein